MAAASETTPTALRQRRSIREIVAYFLRLGTLGFGGPVALCGLMEKELVTEKGWHERGDARRDRGLPGAPRPARDSGRALHCVSARWLLGGMGRGMGVHPAEFFDRRRARCSLRAFWRPRPDDGDLVRRQPGCDWFDPPFLLAPGEARHERLGAMGRLGGLLWRHDLVRRRPRVDQHHSQAKVRTSMAADRREELDRRKLVDCLRYVEQRTVKSFSELLRMILDPERDPNLHARGHEEIGIS